jgi:hypothetical protein
VLKPIDLLLLTLQFVVMNDTTQKVCLYAKDVSKDENFMLILTVKWHEK